MKKWYLVICLFYCSNLFAQYVSGVVRGEDGLFLEDVLIQNARSATHSHTDEAGRFLMEQAIPGDTLRFSRLGYRPVTFIVSVSNEVISLRMDKTPIELNEVVLSSTLRHLQVIAAIDLRTNPVNSSQDLLRKVPGLFIGQHAGGGKAEQIFLRGFDLDHGTDINISVDGMPVNMVSHAHGQGYADLHFLIPETVEKIDFDKGPYYANKGNLATAGYVAFTTKEKVERSSLTLEGGSFHTFRTLGLFNLVNNDRQAAWIATDFLKTDGPFESPQRFKRVNLSGKYTAYFSNDDKLSFGLSWFNSKWNASGQIPERAVASGAIGRFGAIDNTEGGQTGRANINIQYIRHLSRNSYLRQLIFLSQYNFELYSNFTFFLHDPLNGDQIRQKEKRTLTGFETQYARQWHNGGWSSSFQAGTGIRYDATRNSELSHTANRNETLDHIMLGDIDETNVYGYANFEFRKGRWMINPALRYDFLEMEYRNHLSPVYSDSAIARSIVCPKLNFLYSSGKNLQFFLKTGKGFHSNDTRVVVQRNGNTILPAAWGADLGVSSKPIPRMIVTAAAWYLFLQQEFVYVGDEGIVEPSGRSARKGLDLGIRYQLNNWLFFQSDYTFTNAKSIDEPKGSDYIPLAPKHTFTGGLSFSRHGFSGGVKLRWLGDRAANEDHSMVARGYTITDMNLNYEYKKIILGFRVENLFNRNWNETQFATESRLQSEPMAVTEIHFTPGTPFSFRGLVTVSF